MQPSVCNLDSNVLKYNTLAECCWSYSAWHEHTYRNVAVRYALHGFLNMARRWDSLQGKNKAGGKSVVCCRSKLRSFQMLHDTQGVHWD